MVFISPISSDEGLVEFPPNSGSFSTVFSLRDGILEEGRDKGIMHFKHEHVLEFKQNVRNVRCEGCGQEMGGRGFSCMSNCNFHLHEICALFPKEITDYPHHPQHPLTLANVGIKICDVCNRQLHLHRQSFEFYYHCDICKFDVDLRCASMYLNFLGGYHKHELTVNLYPLSFCCSLCGEKDGELGVSYRCKTCLFLIHEQCYYLPDTIQHDDHNNHPLRISSSPLHVTSTFAIPQSSSISFCGVCERKLPDYPFMIYYCARCRYGIHLNCRCKKRDKKMTKKALKILSGNDELIQFPMPFAHSVQNILSDFIKQKCGWKEDRKEPPVLLHHPSHVHPLALSDGPIENYRPDHEFDRPEFDNFNISDRLVNESCNACTLLVLDASFYRCSESCNFVLHTWCAVLPRKIQHQAHSWHTLLLHERVVESFEYFQCKSCCKAGNGFAYKCRECEEYYLDVICASLPSSVKHEDHEHPLILGSYDEHCSCNSCGFSRERKFFFSCDACHFRLDVSCLLLPKEIRHRYDHHGFKLTTLAPTCHEYYCEFCEKELDPNTWIYHCFECDRSADITCVQSRVFNLFRGPTKFGVSYPHLFAMTSFTFIPMFRVEGSDCSECARNLFYKDGYGLFCKESEKILCVGCYLRYLSLHDKRGEPPGPVYVGRRRRWRRRLAKVMAKAKAAL